MRRIRTVAALALMLTLMGSIHAQAQEVAQQDMEDHLNTCDPADYQQQLLDAWFDLLTPTIDGLSQAALLGDVWRIWSDVVKVDDITEDHVAGKWTDELGVEYVHLYGIEKPAG